MKLLFTSIEAHLQDASIDYSFNHIASIFSELQARQHRVLGSRPKSGPMRSVCFHKMLTVSLHHPQVDMGPKSHPGATLVHTEINFSCVQGSVKLTFTYVLMNTRVEPESDHNASFALLGNEVQK